MSIGISAVNPLPLSLITLSYGSFGSNPHNQSIDTSYFVAMLISAATVGCILSVSYADRVVCGIFSSKPNFFWLHPAFLRIIWIRSPNCVFILVNQAFCVVNWYGFLTGFNLTHGYYIVLHNVFRRLCKLPVIVAEETYTPCRSAEDFPPKRKRQRITVLHLTDSGRTEPCRYLFYPRTRYRV